MHQLTREKVEKRRCKASVLFGWPIWMQGAFLPFLSHWLLLPKLIFVVNDDFLGCLDSGLKQTSKNVVEHLWIRKNKQLLKGSRSRILHNFLPFFQPTKTKQDLNFTLWGILQGVYKPPKQINQGYDVFKLENSTKIFYRVVSDQNQKA